MTKEPAEHTTDIRRLIDEDIEALCSAMDKRQGHVCRFNLISSQEVEDSIKFHKHVNQLLSETGTTIRKTILTFGIGGLFALLILGIYAKIKQISGG